MTTLREAATQALEAMEGGADSWQLVGPAIDALKEALVEDAMQKFTDVNQELEAALAEPVLQTCNCRWDGEMQMQQCTLHEAHVDAIKEWAQRAKFAEKKLAALAEPVQDGCDHCNHPLYAAVKCRVCGRVTEPVQETVAMLWQHRETGRTRLLMPNERTATDVAYAWDVVGPLYLAPPKRKPLTDEEIDAIDLPPSGTATVRDFVRIIERAHGIK